MVSKRKGVVLILLLLFLLRGGAVNSDFFLKLITGIKPGIYFDIALNPTTRPIDPELLRNQEA